jgi:hypothetical protein
MELCELHFGRGIRRLDHLAFELWWERYDIPVARVRPFVARQVPGEDAPMALRALGGRGPDPVGAVVSQLLTSVRPRTPLWSALRSNLKDPEDQRSFFTAVVRLAEGDAPAADEWFTGGEPRAPDPAPGVRPEASLAEIFLTGVGAAPPPAEALRDKRVRRNWEARHRTGEDVAAFVQRFAAAGFGDIAGPGRVLREATDAELLQGRDLAHTAFVALDTHADPPSVIEAIQSAQGLPPGLARSVRALRNEVSRHPRYRVAILVYGTVLARHGGRAQPARPVATKESAARAPRRSAP